MWFDHFRHDDDASVQARIEHLENFHRLRHSPVLIALLVGFAVFLVWAVFFHIDEVARARGEVIASSRVQVIQAVDGGVLSQLLVKEGDRVKPGQVIARLDQTRVGASVGEVEARLYGLKAKAIRLRAEATGAAEPAFPKDAPPAFGEQIAVERALFQQRRVGLQEEMRTLKVAVDLARKELGQVKHLLKSGDVSGA